MQVAAARPDGARPERSARTPAAASWPFEPSPEQELLLRAALCDAAEARAAWQAWRGRVAFDDEHVDPGSFRLLPLVWWNLSRAGFDDPVMARLKGIYRLWWVRNRRLVHGARPAIEALAARGIEAMALKGLPLAFEHYESLALRPSSDVDLGVRRRDLEPALAALAASGWRRALAVNAHKLRFWHAVPLLGPDRTILDLHWRPLREVGEDTDAFWENARPRTWEGLTLHAPDATDLLLHTIVHGLAWNPVPPLRWVADASVLLSGGRVDGERLVRRARAWRVALPVREALTYLEARFGVKPPPGAAEALCAAPVPALERIEYRLAHRRSHGAGAWHVRAGHALLRYARVSSDWPLRRQLLEIPPWIVHGLRNRVSRRRLLRQIRKGR